MKSVSAWKAANAQSDPQHDAGLEALRERLESLESHCLTNLVGGLDAMIAGDLTVAVQPATKPLEPCGDPAVDALAEVFNRMLEKAQSGLRGYNTVREDLRGKLGDHSILGDLDTKMKSIDNNCLVSLGKGLEGLRSGDLTIEAHPVTTPIDGRNGDRIGSLGETFNSMLAKAQTGLGGYNEVRETMRAALGDHSILADLDTKMKSIDNNCLVSLGAGLEGLRNGDLTIEAHPVTTSIDARNGESIG